MQAIPDAPAVPVTIGTSKFPDLLPGPFFLLLLLPAIPLLLFSVGARPPDSSSLPFSTNDLWQTTALVTIAGAVVLCVGLYPGMLSGMGGWVINGDYSSGLNVNKWVDRIWVFGSGDSAVSNADEQLGMPKVQVHQAQSQVWEGQNLPVVQNQYHRDAESLISRDRYRSPHSGSRRVPGTPGVPAQQSDPNSRSPQWRKVHDRSAHQSLQKPLRQDLSAVRHQRPIVVTPSQQLLPVDMRSFGSPAERHLAYLCESPYFPWYSSSRPSLFRIVVIAIIVAGLLIILVGRIIGDGYDADSKSRSSSSSSRSSGERSSSSSSGDWVQSEYTKRKAEKDIPEVTIARMNKEKLAWDTKNKARSEEDRKKYVERKSEEVQKLKEMLKAKNLPNVGLEVWEDGAGEIKVTKKEVKVEETKKDGRELKSWERFLLGKKKTGGTKDEKRKVTMVETPKEGPGWKMSDEHVTQAAMAQQASRAEDLAKSMKAA